MKLSIHAYDENSYIPSFLKGQYQVLYEFRIISRTRTNVWNQNQVDFWTRWKCVFLCLMGFWRESLSPSRISGAFPETSLVNNSTDVSNWFKTHNCHQMSGSNRGPNSTNPNNAVTTPLLPGKSLKIDLDLHCLIPPKKWVIEWSL